MGMRTSRGRSRSGTRWYRRISIGCIGIIVRGVMTRVVRIGVWVRMRVVWIVRCWCWCRWMRVSLTMSLLRCSMFWHLGGRYRSRCVLGVRCRCRSCRRCQRVRARASTSFVYRTSARGRACQGLISRHGRCAIANGMTNGTFTT